MPIFAPAFRIDKSQQTPYARAEKRAHKRRRLEDQRDSNSTDHDTNASDADSDPNNNSQPAVPSSRVSVRSAALHISKTDPYYVAGLARDEEPPPPPFPHAAARIARPEASSIEEQLVSLNPPVYAYREGGPHKAAPFRRRHADNLTTILHTCMLDGDWARASRAWGLLLRTELGGRDGFDVRRHGRWSIGAELLLRSQDDDEHDTGEADAGFSSVKGFELVREYYERLALQYPSTRWTQHRVNSESIYPALFSAWVYHIQARAKRIRQIPAKRASLSSYEEMGDVSDECEEDAWRYELDGAESIARRLDELLIGPPFDRSIPLLRLRGFVGLWIADLCDASDREDPGLPRDRAQQARDERAKGVALLHRVRNAGHDIGVTIPDEYEDDRSDDSTV